MTDVLRHLNGQSVPDPAILGQILLLQSTIHAAPDEKCLAEMLVHEMTLLPGVADCTLCIEGLITKSRGSCGTPASAHCPLNSDTPLVSCSDCRVARFPSHEGWQRFELRTYHREYGAFFLNIRDQASFAPYSVFVGNTANLTALVIENDRVAMELNRVNRGLDELVEERTSQLREAHALLEQRVEERTAELKVRTDEAEKLNTEMATVMKDLQTSNARLEAATRELIASNKELDSFSYSVSHDLRAPLRHIDGFIKLLMKNEKDRLGPESLRFVERIVVAVGRMGQLIDDLLAFSRMGRGELHLERVNSNEIVEHVRSELCSSAEDRRIAWDIGELPAVLADGSLLRQVWENLIGNAIKYTGPRENAHIEIGATREGVTEEKSTEVAFFVRDNGVGFDPQYTNQLFGVFHRLHRADEFEGTGIGLANVRRIVERHGGRVWAEGELERGATFYFTLQGSEE